jgi:hypothetical protein
MWTFLGQPCIGTSYFQEFKQLWGSRVHFDGMHTSVLHDKIGTQDWRW